jgi:hypothetical protein
VVGATVSGDENRVRCGIRKMRTVGVGTLDGPGKRNRSRVMVDQRTRGDQGVGNVGWDVYRGRHNGWGERGDYRELRQWRVIWTAIVRSTSVCGRGNACRCRLSVAISGSRHNPRWEMVLENRDRSSPPPLDGGLASMVETNERQ